MENNKHRLVVVSYDLSSIENGDSDFKELKEKSHLEEILKSEIKNISKMKEVQNQVHLPHRLRLTMHDYLL